VPAVRGLEPGKRAALVVNEMQNAIANPAYVDTPLAGQVTARGIVARINTLTAAFRAAGAPVIFAVIAARTPDFDGFLVNCALAARIKRTGKLVLGTPGGAIHDDLVVEPSDIVSHRSHGMAPFTGTTLDATLRGYGIGTVVLSGVSTNIALPGAATEAVALGYSVVLAEDCTAGATPETHQMQVSMHLPLLATVTGAESVIASLGLSAGSQEVVAAVRGVPSERPATRSRWPLKVSRASGVSVLSATMAVRMTSHSSARTSSQVWVTPLRGFWPSVPMTAWLTSPASSVSFMMRSSFSVSGASVLLSSSHPTIFSMVPHTSSMYRDASAARGQHVGELAGCL
jgi:nicotinamidase-related amidase